MNTACLSVLGALVFSFAAGQPAPGSVVPVKEGETTLFTYRVGPAPNKSYVQELFTPSGLNVIRDQVPDHIHHHGLMFALGVDGVTFWGELPEAGKEVSKRFQQSGASLTEELEWVLPDGKRVLRELRTVKGTAAAKDGPALVEWTSRLEADKDGGKITLTGDHYYGLGMRFAEDMDKQGPFMHSSGAPGELVRGKEHNTPGEWCAYTAKTKGKPVTVAMFAAPSNPRHPTVWFTMPEGFAYLSATLNLWKQPLPLSPGDTLTLTYAVAVWDGAQSPETIDAACKAWQSGK